MEFPSVIVFFAILGLLVFVHELGHFLAAKSVGVAVEEFAFGFGPRLVTLFRRSGTEYTIHALPLGGFVNLVGMQPEEAHFENGLMSKPAWARAFVFLAGPAMNLLLAIVVLCSMGLITGLPTGRQSNSVFEVHKDTEAARVGLQTGDRIVRVNDRPLTTGSELIEAIESHPGERVLLTVERQGKTLQISARPTPEIHLVPFVLVDSVEPGGQAARLGIRPGDRLTEFDGVPIVRSLSRLQDRMEERGEGREARADRSYVLTFQRGQETLKIRAEGSLRDLSLRMEESPLARELGLRLGDRITAVNGRRVRLQSELEAVLRQEAGRPVTLTVLRGQTPVTLDPRPIPPDLAGPENIRTVGKMGFLPGYEFRGKVGFAESVRAGWESFLGFFVHLYNETVKRRLLKNAGSIVTIGRAVDLYSKLSAGYMFHLVANLSLSLAVFNLLPIPVLDGGHLALLSVEVIRRRRLGPSAYRLATAIGFAVVVLAFVLLIYSDVTRWRSGSPLINP